jgi:hypothetical protein
MVDSADCIPVGSLKFSAPWKLFCGLGKISHSRLDLIRQLHGVLGVLGLLGLGLRLIVAILGLPVCSDDLTTCAPERLHPASDTPEPP